MSGNKSKPSKTGAEKVSDPIVEEPTKEEKSTKSEFSSKIAQYMNKSKSKKKGNGVDPIIAVSAIVLLLCCAIVIGYTIYDKSFADHTEPDVEYGDTVNVRYVGSFYGYYDADGSVIFDTNIQDVAENPDYAFSHEWTMPEKFDLYKVTVGSGGSLAMFEDALIGHHPGETVYVTIPAGEGYQLKGGYHEGKVAGHVIDQTRVFESKDAFEDFFGEAPLEGGIHTIQSPYGWYANYGVCNNGTVQVTYNAVAGTTYSKEGDDVQYQVTDVSGGKITYTLVFEWDGKMLQTFDDDGNTIYITNYYSTDVGGRVAGDYDYKIKTGDTASDDREVSGEKLFFVIEIVEYVE